ncbi:YwdI family protein [Ureibacillus sp. Re31]|uniref:YwdI family protein n=1 Tax=Ureibacillus galli TaxID=2762222 RepID=A0ABR8X8W2_9BACL|nr:YwdI family protein [Ureibacillus galli]MBD8025527.1 YwdI family protein [Ureibacillus galli]
MISYHQLLDEIEQLVAEAKGTQDEQQVREQLSAIRALCNVALTRPNNNQSVELQKITTTYSNNIPSPSNVIHRSSIHEHKLQEKDANGDSIFDF